MGDLIHYSDQPICSVQSIEQHAEPSMKPKGLWLSVEDGESWLDWCKAEGFGLGRLRYRHTIELSGDAKILWLRSVTDILIFSDQYIVERSPIWHSGINWQPVADRWQGIIIAPYQWSCHLSDACSWYYGWDCSSGVIWDSTAIASLSMREVTLHD